MKKDSFHSHVLFS